MSPSAADADVVHVRHGRETYTFEHGMTVKRLLRELDIVPEGVIVTVNGELVTRDLPVRKGDEVEIIRAISGGAARARRDRDGRGAASPAGHRRRP